MKNGLTVTKNQLPQLLKRIEDLTKKHVLVGIPQDSERDDDSEVSNARVGYWMEYGTVDTPARPFLEPGVIASQNRLVPILVKGARAAMEGNTEAAEKALMAAGMVAVDSVKNELTNGDHAPLAESTLRARKARGFEGERPLIETGSLRNAITFVLEEKK